MACNNCSNTPCSCEDKKYSYNWYNVDNYSCNPCSTQQVCKKVIPAKCTIYKGAPLTDIGLTNNIDIEQIIAAIHSTISTIKQTNSEKFSNILAALNDINARLNLITGINHPQYTI